MMLRPFFYLPRSDRRVLLLLLLAAGVLMAGLWLMGGEAEPAAEADAQPDTLLLPPHRAAATPLYYAAAPRRVERFAFDPNTADSSALLRLGLQPWQVRGIYKYRAAGGIYRTKQDFARVYGLTQKEYRELEPYIVISPDYRPAALLVARQEAPRDTLLFPEKLRQGQTVDLATADTAELKRVPGIGSYYARQIALYGHRLGGYVSVDQLDEIAHFPPDAKPYFVLSAAAPQQLLLNRLSLAELKQHPYLNYYQARAIVDYRRKHGPLRSLDDLRLLPDFTAADLQRLEPYVSMQ